MNLCMLYVKEGTSREDREGRVRGMGTETSSKIETKPRAILFFEKELLIYGFGRVILICNLHT